MNHDGVLPSWRCDPGTSSRKHLKLLGDTEDLSPGLPRRMSLQLPGCRSKPGRGPFPLESVGRGLTPLPPTSRSGCERLKDGK